MKDIRKMRQSLNSNFHAIDEWEDRRSHALNSLLPQNAQLAVTNNTDIVLIIEHDSGLERVNLLDRLATTINVSEKLNVVTRHRGKQQPYLTKDNAEKIAQILNEQSKKLEALSVTYRLMANALLISKDRFKEVSQQSDMHLNKVLNNPFE